MGDPALVTHQMLIRSRDVNEPEISAGRPDLDSHRRRHDCRHHQRLWARRVLDSKRVLKLVARVGPVRQRNLETVHWRVCRQFASPGLPRGPSVRSGIASRARRCASLLVIARTTGQVEQRCRTLSTPTRGLRPGQARTREAGFGACVGCWFPCRCVDPGGVGGKRCVGPGSATPLVVTTRPSDARALSPTAV